METHVYPRQFHPLVSGTPCPRFWAVWVSPGAPVCWRRRWTLVSVPWGVDWLAGPETVWLWREKRLPRPRASCFSGPVLRDLLGTGSHW